MNNIHELLTREEAARLCQKDAALMSTKPGEYAKANTFSYYVAVNCWLFIFKECDQYAWQTVKRHIMLNGLVSSIKECCDDADRVVHGEEVVSPIGVIANNIKGARATSTHVSTELNFLHDDMATLLQLLRFLKRFSPCDNDIVQTESIRKFTAIENRSKLLQRKELPRYHVWHIQNIIENLIDWDSLVQEWDEMEVFDFIPTPGTSAEGLKTLGDKLSYLSLVYPDMFKQPFGLSYVLPFWDRPWEGDSDYSVVKAVPKSYKASRIIAMEPVRRQSYANAMAKIWQRYLPKFIDITDQSRNQYLAFIGSKYGMMATLDFSNASDTVTKTMLREFFPQKVLDRIEPLLSTYTRVGERRRPMQMASTAGHSFTFIIETIVFYAIAKYACDLTLQFNDDIEEYLCYASVYGDDVCISTYAVDTAIDIYTELGFILNEDKSFTTGQYRESCGEEYYNGIRLTTTYYPRFPVIGRFSKNGVNLGKRLYKDTYRGKTDDSTTMLIDLQKRLYYVSYEASMFVRDLILSARPGITSSVAGSSCPDMWDFAEVAKSYVPSGYTIEGEKIELSPCIAQYVRTTVHSYVQNGYVGPKAVLMIGFRKFSDPFENFLLYRAFDIYKYQRFLKTGPTYASELDKLLGVSEPPMSVDQAYGEMVMKWGKMII
jgi:hypothetical protein